MYASASFVGGRVTFPVELSTSTVHLNVQTVQFIFNVFPEKKSCVKWSLFAFTILDSFASESRCEELLEEIGCSAFAALPLSSVPQGGNMSDTEVKFLS